MGEVCATVQAHRKSAGIYDADRARFSASGRKWCKLYRDAGRAAAPIRRTDTFPTSIQPV